MDTRNPSERYEGYGNWRDLVDSLERGVEGIADPHERCETHLRIGQLWEERFLEKAKAVFHYQKAFKADQKSVKALRHARRVYREMGKPRIIAQLANLELKLIKSIDGENKSVARELFFELGEALADIGEVEKALQCYQQVFSFSPDDPDAAAHFEDLEIESGWAERAGVLAENAAALASSDPVAASATYLRAARLLLRFETTNPKVEEYLNAAAALDATNVTALNLLENTLEGEGRREHITTVHDELIASTTDVAARARRAQAIGSRWAVRFEDRDAARHYLQIALENDPSLESAFNMLVNICR